MDLVIFLIVAYCRLQLRPRCNRPASAPHRFFIAYRLLPLGRYRFPEKFCPQLLLEQNFSKELSGLVSAAPYAPEAGYTE